MIERLKDGETLRLYYDPSWTTCCVQATGIIHEMGHVFVDLEYGDDEEPGEDREFGFVGWEFLVAQKLDCVEHWYESMSAYGIVNLPTKDEFKWPYGEGASEFGNLDDEQRQHFLNDRLRVARKKKYVRRNTPLVLR